MQIPGQLAFFSHMILSHYHVQEQLSLSIHEDWFHDPTQTPRCLSPLQKKKYTVFAFNLDRAF